MADIASSFTKVNDVEVASDAPVTEALNFKYGGNDNYLFDELVAQDARLDLLETSIAEKSSIISGSTVSNTPVSVGSDTITPSTANVFIFIEGRFTQNIGNAGVAVLKRGATTLRTLQVGSDIFLEDFGFLDLNATANSSNTYSIEVTAQAGNTLTYNFSISLINIK